MQVQHILCKCTRLKLNILSHIGFSFCLWPREVCWGSQVAKQTNSTGWTLTLWTILAQMRCWSFLTKLKRWFKSGRRYWQYVYATKVLWPECLKNICKSTKEDKSRSLKVDKTCFTKQDIQRDREQVKSCSTYNNHITNPYIIYNIYKIIFIKYTYIDNYMYPRVTQN